MDYFVDTNVLLRALTPKADQAPAARRALRTLRRERQGLVIFPQTVMELWSVCTRPKPPAGNRLGFDAALAERCADFVEGFFSLLPDRPEIHTQWRRLAASHRISGRRVFDARLVAAMLVYGVPRVLTFNVSDFSAFTEIEVVNPIDVGSAS